MQSDSLPDDVREQIRQLSREFVETSRKPDADDVALLRRVVGPTLARSLDRERARR